MTLSILHAVVRLMCCHAKTMHCHTNHMTSGPYTGGVRGGSDEPPFFGQVACTRYKLYPRLQLTCFFIVQLKCRFPNNAHRICYRYVCTLSQHNNIVFGCQCSSKINQPQNGCQNASEMLSGSLNFQNFHNYVTLL